MLAAHICHSAITPVHYHHQSTSMLRLTNTPCTLYVVTVPDGVAQNIPTKPPILGALETVAAFDEHTVFKVRVARLLVLTQTQTFDKARAEWKEMLLRIGCARSADNKMAMYDLEQQLNQHSLKCHPLLQAYRMIQANLNGDSLVAGSKYFYVEDPVLLLSLALSFDTVGSQAGTDALHTLLKALGPQGVREAFDSLEKSDFYKPTREQLVLIIKHL